MTFQERMQTAWDDVQSLRVVPRTDQTDGAIRLAMDTCELAIRLGRLREAPNSVYLKECVQTQCVRVANWGRAIDEGIEKAEELQEKGGDHAV